jgi:dienelactone hydrolase
MIKKIFFSILIIIHFQVLHAQQNLRLEKFGFRYFSIIYEKDTVNVLVKSKKGEELKQKPIFFFCQGSLPVPLILLDEKGPFGTFPFTADSIISDYHLVIIGKPGVPVVAEIAKLNKDFTYYDTKTSKFPKEYTQRNYLEYYVNRNKAVINFLQKHSWVSKKKLVVAGHSEGSSIAASMATQIKTITHLVYSGGNPLGRMMTIITRGRQNETDSLSTGELLFTEWKKITEQPEISETNEGDSYKTTFSFSKPLIESFSKINIPVLVSYGTKDYGAAPFNDYLRFEMMRIKKPDIFFKAYIGKEHNYFSLKKDGETDFDDYNWDKVVHDWLIWLKNN